MSTTIRQLLGEVSRQHAHALQQPPSPGLADSARTLIGAAAGGLARLQVWRPDWNPDLRATHLAEDLRLACSEVGAGAAGGSSRPVLLLAAATDAIGVLISESTPAWQRWAITHGLAYAVTQAVEVYQAHGPALPDPGIGRARLAAATVLRAGRQLVRGPGRALLDSPIPDPHRRARGPAGAHGRGGRRPGQRHRPGPHPPAPTPRRCTSSSSGSSRWPPSRR